jgi:metallo-beta-lactamase family protein
MDLILRDLKTKAPIYLDSPMAIKATQLYRDFKAYLRFQSPILDEPDRDFFSFPNLHETLSVDASKAINDAPSPKIIIAGSGMMNGGRIMHHLQRYLPLETTMILVIGYQAVGTIGRQIFEGAKTVRIYGQPVVVRAKIKGIGAFSAHGDQNKLTRWMKPEDGVMPKKIFLVHGDEDAKVEFAEHLRKELKTEVLIPKEGMTVDLS